MIYDATLIHIETRSTHSISTLTCLVYHKHAHVCTLYT